MSIPDSYSPPRICQLRKWQDFPGYGFNLHAEKGKPGQFIGKIDPGSPADFGGLKERDVLVEVNDVNVEEFSHQQVVNQAKAIDGQVKLLVCAMDTYRYCKENQISVTRDMPEVEMHETPESRPDSQLEQQMVEAQIEEQQNEYDQAELIDENDDEITGKPVIFQTTVPIEDVPGPELGPDTEAEMQSHQVEQQPVRARTPSPTPAPTPARPAPTPAPTPAASRDPVGSVSLQEMLAKTGQSKRNKVKYDPSSFADKYQSFQAL